MSSNRPLVTLIGGFVLGICLGCVVCRLLSEFALLQPGDVAAGVAGAAVTDVHSVRPGPPVVEGSRQWETAAAFYERMVALDVGALPRDSRERRKALGEVRKWVVCVGPAERQALRDLVLAGNRVCDDTPQGPANCQLQGEWMLDGLLEAIASYDPQSVLETLALGVMPRDAGELPFEELMGAWGTLDGGPAFDGSMELIRSIPSPSIRGAAAVGLAKALRNPSFSLRGPVRRRAILTLLDNWPPEQREQRLPLMDYYISCVSWEKGDVARAFDEMERRAESREERISLYSQAEFSAWEGDDGLAAREAYLRATKLLPQFSPTRYISTVAVKQPDLALRYAREVLDPAQAREALASLLRRRIRIEGLDATRLWAQGRILPEEWDFASGWIAEQDARDKAKWEGKP